MAKRPPLIKTASKTANIVKLGLIQHASPPGVAAKTILDTTCKMITQAAKDGAKIIATQELFLTHYFCQIEDETRFKLAESIPGPTTTRLCSLAKKLKVYITASLFEKRAPGLYHNTSVMISDKGEIVGKYRKMHIPDDPRFYEKYYFTPGDLGFGSHATPWAKAGMLVCWDQWYPEAARLTALSGAQVIFYPTAIGWYHKETPFDRKQQKDAWQTIQRSHAIANGVFVAAVNRIGVEEELEFWGGSFVADPGGVIIAQASDDKEEILLADCDLGRMDEIRQGWPFLRDRRIDAYKQIDQRYID